MASMQVGVTMSVGFGRYLLKVLVGRLVVGWLGGWG